MPHSSSHVPSAKSARGAPKWSQERRLEFIDFRLRWEGRLNRGDLVDFFGISTPQASLDIARYADLAPANLVYDRSGRIYLAGAAFKPVFPTTQPAHYLNDLLAAAAGLESEPSFMGWCPPVATTPIPGRTMSAITLAALLRAIREGCALRVTYQSMTRPEPTERVLSPHALAHDGFRWHVRAFCHSRNQFRDFVIARILSIAEIVQAMPLQSDDKEWQTVVKLVLAPHPGLSLAHQRVIELDYGMENGEAKLECRQALLFYLLRNLGLDGKTEKRPEAQQIVLKNAEEIAHYLSAIN